LSRERKRVKSELAEIQLQQQQQKQQQQEEVNLIYHFLLSLFCLHLQLEYHFQVKSTPSFAIPLLNLLFLPIGVFQACLSSPIKEFLFFGGAVFLLKYHGEDLAL